MVVRRGEAKAKATGANNNTVAATTASQSRHEGLWDTMSWHFIEGNQRPTTVLIQPGNT
jgi:hypothetical protein